MQVTPGMLTPESQNDSRIIYCADATAGIRYLLSEAVVATSSWVSAENNSLIGRAMTRGNFALTRLLDVDGTKNRCLHPIRFLSR